MQSQYEPSKRQQYETLKESYREYCNPDWNPMDNPDEMDRLARHVRDELDSNIPVDVISDMLSVHPGFIEEVEGILAYRISYLR